MSDARAEGEGAKTPIVLAGRIKREDAEHFQLELVDGLTVDLRRDDCATVTEVVDPITMRPTVRVELHGDKPLTTTVQPHVLRALSSAGQVPFVFTGTKGLPDGGFVLGLAYVSADRPGGGGGLPDHDTTVHCTSWLGTTQQDGTKGDSSSEPGDIYLP
jgi:hypothetical protein